MIYSDLTGLGKNQTIRDNIHVEYNYFSATLNYLDATPPTNIHDDTWLRIELNGCKKIFCSFFYPLYFLLVVLPKDHFCEIINHLHHDTLL